MTRPAWAAWLDLDADGFLPPADHGERRRRIQAWLARLAPDGLTAALLVTGAANLRWATGFSGTNGALLVTPDGETLLTDARYEGRAAVECRGLDVHITRRTVETALSLAVDAGVDRLAFEGDHLSYHAAMDLQVAVAEVDLGDAVAVNGAIEQLRIVKDDAELARLARACAVTERALDEVLDDGLVGRTEREVATLVEDAIRRNQSVPGFPTIVAAGGNGAVPHHEPTSRVIGEGDLVTIDCGARIDGYHADTTRTVAAGALPSGEVAAMVDVFDLVAEAQQRGVEAVVTGATGADVDAACRDHIAASGMGDAFVHGTGHGVGLDIHEAPAVAAGAAATLQPRTALTVEPGIYLPGRGGVRIEDTVVVTAEGAACRLTNSPRTLLVV